MCQKILIRVCLVLCFDLNMRRKKGWKLQKLFMSQKLDQSKLKGPKKYSTQKHFVMKKELCPKNNCCKNNFKHFFPKKCWSKWRKSWKKHSLLHYLVNVDVKKRKKLYRTRQIIFTLYDKNEYKEKGCS